MPVTNLQRLVFLVTFLFTAHSLADPPTSLQSDWLDFVRGERDERSGVEVLDVVSSQEPGMQQVTLSIPKTALANPDEIEEVIVVGRRPDTIELQPIDISYEWVDDPDGETYGLLIRLGSDSQWPVRLYLNSSAGYLNN